MTMTEVQRKDAVAIVDGSWWAIAEDYVAQCPGRFISRNDTREVVADYVSLHRAERTKQESWKTDDEFQKWWWSLDFDARAEVIAEAVTTAPCF